MKQSATLNQWVRQRLIPRCKSNVKIYLTMLFLLSGMIFVTQKSDAQCNSFGIDFKQAANRDNFGTYVTGELHWINSILQQSNSRYIEGMSTLQRVVFDNLPSCGGNHVLRVKLEARKADQHAYDFITSWDNALKAAAAIAPGFGLMPSDRSDPKLHECGPAIGSCSETACNLVTNGGTGTGAGSDYRDLPIIFSDYANPLGPGEKNLTIEGPPADENTTRQVIQTYECRYGDNITIPAGQTYAGTYDRSVRVYVDGGFIGANGDANNAVVFVGYGDANPNDGGDTYIYYDIKWSSTSTSVVIEFAAHIAVGVDGLAAIDPGSCNVTSLGVGYLLNRGASSISGGPYHVIIEDFQDAPGNTPNCEPNLGNQDNQLQGSEILLIPECDLQGPSAVCANGTATYTATVTNPDNATYLWEIISSSQSPPAATINGTASGDVPAPIFPATTTPLSITVSTGGVGTYTVQLTIKNGGQTTNNTDDDITSTCTVTTTVSGGPTITCPSNTSTAACQTQAAVDAAYVAWLATVSGTGTPTHDGGTSGPDKCGGTKTVVFTATNTCGTSTCSASFTVTAPASVTLNCASNTTVAACSTQAAVDAAYAAWLATASASGGCDRTLTNNSTGAPSRCGGSKTVVFTVTSSCEATKTCSASFTVTAPASVTLNCASNTTVGACQSQAAVDAAYAAWLATATSSGGCDRTQTNNSTGAPSRCGGSKTVVFTVTSSCEATKTCSASFTVTAPASVTLNCASNTTVASCQSQATVDAAYAAWLATASASGGCDRSFTNNSTGAPDKCGGSKTVTWTVTSSCEATKTCSASFTVTAPASVTLNCASNTTVSACLTQEQVNAAYAAWLGTANATGGCDRLLTNNSTGAPDRCGGSKTVVFTVTSSCEATKTCSASFTVTADNTPPTLICAANYTAECGGAPVFGQPSASDACGEPTVVTVGEDVVEGSCPTTYTRTWMATDACGNTSTCSQTVSVPCCAANCTYTQGAYGTEGGKMCDGTTGGFSTEDFIEHILDNLGGSLVIGCAGHSVTINSGDADCVIDKLPGGGASGPLPAGDNNICTLPASMLKNGRINNALLAQTITLGLNMGINGQLGSFALEVNKWLVTADLIECGSTTVKECEFSCVPDLINIGQYIWEVTYTPYHVTDCRISQALYDALTTKDVSGLYALANSALCGDALPAGVTYSDITKAVDCINNAFDGCRASTGWVAGDKPTAESFCNLPSPNTACPITETRITSQPSAEVVAETGLNVSAYPNPFRDKVSFVIKSRVSGQATLEVYNMLGQRIQTVYNGNVVAERTQIVEYRVPQTLNGGLIYIFKQGGKQVSGKLLNIE